MFHEHRRLLPHSRVAVSGDKGSRFIAVGFTAAGLKRESYPRGTLVQCGF